MEMLGEGAFAVVYRAIHRSTNQEVAIKMVNLNLIFIQLRIIGAQFLTSIFMNL